MQKRKYSENEGGEELGPPKPVSYEEFYQKTLMQKMLIFPNDFEVLTDGQIEYSRYFVDFYELHLKDALIKGYHQQPWFAERNYCKMWKFEESFVEFRDFAVSREGASMLLTVDNAENLLGSEIFDKYKGDIGAEEGLLAVIKNIPAEASVNQLLDVLKNLTDISECGITQHRMAENNTRTIYAPTDAESFKTLKEKLDGILPEQSIVILQQLPPHGPGSLREVGAQFGDVYELQRTKQTCKEILRAMSNLFFVPQVPETLQALEKSVASEEVPDMYVLALRKIFNFCYYCGMKFDNPYDMMLKCGSYHVRSMKKISYHSPALHTESLSVYLLERRLQFETKKKEGSSIKLFYAEGSSPDEYICKYCGKKFMEEQYFVKHLTRKHVEYEAYLKLQESYNKVIESLTYPVIEMIENWGCSMPQEIKRYIHKKKREREEKEIGLTSYKDLEKKYCVLEDSAPIAVIDGHSEEEDTAAEDNS